MLPKRMRWLAVGAMFCVCQAGAGEMRLDVFEQLLGRAHQARRQQQELQQRERAEEGIRLEPWYSVGPLKDEAYGNLLRSFQHPFPAEKDVLAAGAGEVQIRADDASYIDSLVRYFHARERRR